jgi:pyruvate,water dikinase
MLHDMVKATAVVTDSGGRMCHAAINCLEFGVPFVVGTTTATAFIKTGDILEVDPEKGTVTVVEEA